MVAPAVAAAGISAGASLLGGVLGGSSAKKAAKYQLQAAREQIAAAERNRDYQYSLNAPSIDRGDRASELFAGFIGAGTDTVDWEAYARSNPGIADYYLSHNGRDLFTKGDSMSLADYGKAHYDTYGASHGIDLAPYTTKADSGQSQEALDAFRGSTGYQDLVREGLAAVDANAYARGLGRSGATYKALQERGMSLADRSAGDWLGNLNTLMNYGGQARGLVANVGTNTVNAVNSATQSGADAASNAALLSGQNWVQALQGIGLAASQAYGSSYGGGSTSTGAAPYYPAALSYPTYSGYGLNPGFA